MLKNLIFAGSLLLVSIAGAGQDKSVHHSAMHAEHWVDHHVSAPHKNVVHHKVKHAMKKKDKSVHHAAIHAEHWVDHHVSAPHKKN